MGEALTENTTLPVGDPPLAATVAVRVTAVLIVTCDAEEEIAVVVAFAAACAGVADIAPASSATTEKVIQYFLYNISLLSFQICWNLR